MSTRPRTAGASLQARHRLATISTSPASKSRTLVRLLDTAGQRPLSDDEFETMKDVAVLDMLCTYWEQALEPCARCGVVRDLHRQWRAFAADPSVAGHQFTPPTASPPEPLADQAAADAPTVSVPVATADVGTAATAPGPGAPRRSWRHALVERLRMGQRHPLNQP